MCVRKNVREEFEPRPGEAPTRALMAEIHRAHRVFGVRPQPFEKLPRSEAEMEAEMRDAAGGGKRLNRNCIDRHRGLASELDLDSTFLRARACTEA